MTPVRSVVLGTAGHIDHGKTVLVLALTGTDTDRLPEEKARGITIDLGFAALDLEGPGGRRFDVSVIDVPGHHAFVRNMLAGAGGIDAVMLVVAADEGVKAQTVEHLAICRLLGIERGLAVLTKSDVVSRERLAEARAEVAALVKGTFLEGTAVIAVSALRREGLLELRAALARLAAEVPARSRERVMRLPVDRVFTVRGFGTVVTGTLQAGSVLAGDLLRLEPGGRPVRVRGLQVHGQARAEALAPNRVALNLAGVEVADVTRGQMVVPQGTLEPVSVVDAEVSSAEGMAGLRHRQRVRLHAFAGETLATVLLYDATNGRARRVRLRLAMPMVLVPGDRFVLRQPSPALTLGGGRVLDAHPLPKLRKALVAGWLEKLQAGDTEEVVRLRIGRRGTTGILAGTLVTETGLTAEALQQRVALLVAERRVIGGREGGVLLDSAAVARAEDDVCRKLQEDARRQVSRAELRDKVRLSEAVFSLVLERLQRADRLAVRGDAITLPGYGPEAGTDRAVDGKSAAVKQMYRSAGLAAPIVSEVAERLKIGVPELRGVVTSLLRAGTLVRLGSDALLVHGEALAGLAAELRAKHRGRSFDVGWFKDFTGLTRKHAIPLLEYLDGARVTRNVGGIRVVI